ncbi:hypothetical protein BJ170DRAFT_693436 [Xylariales sp. AK1849]|nr:hypothetical protein BJ170DRAFT_693436 [Xylariales sp. AK1849]
MGLVAGGLFQQTIELDTQPFETWDVETSVMFKIQNLDPEAFSEATRFPPPSTTIDANTYKQYGFPFFEIWVEAKRAETSGEEVKEEESMPQRVHINGKFRSRSWRD